MNSTLQTLTEIIQSITQNTTTEITVSTKASDVPGWDSLTHIYIISDVEKRFGIRLAAREAQNMKTVGDFIQIIESKLK
jgi:acyl carrier protein